MTSLMTKSIAKAKGIHVRDVTPQMRMDYRAEERIYALEMTIHVRANWRNAHKLKADFVADAMRQAGRMGDIKLISTHSGVQPVEE